MSAIDKNAAENLANQFIIQLGLSAGDQFEMLPEETAEVEQGWVFFFNTIDFVRMKDPVYALAGNGPIFVSCMGEVSQLPSVIPWKDALGTI